MGPGSTSCRALLAVFWLYPILWVLGVQGLSWVAAAAVVAPALLHRRADLRMPGGFGVWLLLLGWVLISAFTLHDVGRAEAAIYRSACYLAGTIFMVALVNADEQALPTRTVVRALTSLWAWAVGLAVVALRYPDVQFDSPFERLLPKNVAEVPFVQALVHPHLAAHDLVVHVVRPEPMFDYTNSWGAAVGLLTPIVVYGFVQRESGRGRVAVAAGLAVSIVPIVVSVNRGLWISLVVAIGWVVLRRLGRGDVRALAIAVAGTTATAALVLVTPLLGIIEDRFANPNALTRETLYHAALRVTAESPLFGFGAPVSSAGVSFSNHVAIGTHGQFWTVLVSQGVPGAFLLCAFLLAMIVVTWRVSDPGLWLQGVLVAAFVQIFFYDLLPVGICIYAVALALCLRECQPAREPVRAARWPVPRAEPRTVLL